MMLGTNVGARLATLSAVRPRVTCVLGSAGLEQARRFRCCCNQDAGLRTEPQAKLQLIPDIQNNPGFDDLWGQCRAAPAHYRRNTASAFPRLRPFLLTGLTDPRRNARKNKGVISGFSVSLIMCTGCAVSLLGDLVVTSAESKPSPLHPGGGFLLISACRFECVGPEVAAPVRVGARQSVRHAGR